MGDKKPKKPIVTVGGAEWGCNTLVHEFIFHIIHGTPRFLSPCITPLLPFPLSHVLHGISTISSFMRFFLTLSGINSSLPSKMSERTVIMGGKDKLTILTKFRKLSHQ